MSLLNSLQLPSADVPRGKETEKTDCPLCGYRFAAAEAACSGCAMMRGCSMLKCPNCHYEFVAESKLLNWFSKIWKHWKERKNHHV